MYMYISSNRVVSAGPTEHMLNAVLTSARVVISTTEVRVISKHGQIQEPLLFEDPKTL